MPKGCIAKGQEWTSFFLASAPPNQPRGTGSGCPSRGVRQELGEIDSMPAGSSGDWGGKEGGESTRGRKDISKYETPSARVADGDAGREAEELRRCGPRDGRGAGRRPIVAQRLLHQLLVEENETAPLQVGRHLGPGLPPRSAGSRDGRTGHVMDWRVM